jgi:hypothetical protein
MLYRAHLSNILFWARRGGGRMVVSFTNTYVISANHHCSCEFEYNDEVCLIQHYVIMFVSNLQQVGGFPPWDNRYSPSSYTSTIGGNKRFADSFEIDLKRT